MSRVVRIPPAALKAAAEVRMRQYESEYSLGGMTWRDFVPEVREVLQAALPHVAASRDHGAIKLRRWINGQLANVPASPRERGYQAALEAVLNVLGRRGMERAKS